MLFHVTVGCLDRLEFWLSGAAQRQTLVDFRHLYNMAEQYFPLSS